MGAEPSSAIDDDACKWVIRMDRGLSLTEREALAAWLADDGRRQGALLRAQAAYSRLDRARALRSPEEEEPEPEPEPEAAEPPATHLGRRRALQLGGGMAAALALGIGWRSWPSSTHIATMIGEIRRVPLEDGSLAMVNSDSNVRIAFSPGSRDVELLKGEAWFEVRKNRARPFTVTTGAVRVQAVGTAFDVRRYRDQSEIVVTEGVVKIWSVGAGGEPVMVSAGHKAIIGLDPRGARAIVSPVDSEQLLAWREGRIVFDDVTLADAAEEFNRYNAVKLAVDPGIAGRRMIGSFQVNDVDGFVEASAMLVGGDVKRGAGTIHITGEKMR